MHYVYLLQDSNQKLYIGYSNNLRRRIAEHHAGKVYTTKRMHNCRLIYYEAYSNSKLAKLREKNLKKFASAYYSLLKRLNM